MVNHEQRAFAAWTVLTETALRNAKITYKQIAAAIGIHHRPVKYVLALIQEYCITEGLPPLTILVVNQNSGVPGAGFIGWGHDDLERGFRRVHSYPWQDELNPFAFAQDGTTSDGIAQWVYDSPQHAADAYALVRVRGMAQRVFRSALLKAYQSRCAICGLTNEQLLEAAHLVPWSECDAAMRMNPANGILLCSNHHKLFDKGEIRINSDYTVTVSHKLKIRSACDREFIASFQGKTISVPDNPAYHPNLPAIE